MTTKGKTFPLTSEEPTGLPKGYATFFSFEAHITENNIIRGLLPEQNSLIDVWPGRRFRSEQDTLEEFVRMKSIVIFLKIFRTPHYQQGFDGVRGRPQTYPEQWRGFWM